MRAAIYCPSAYNIDQTFAYINAQKFESLKCYIPKLTCTSRKLNSSKYAWRKLK